MPAPDSFRNPRTLVWALAFALAFTYFWVRGPGRALAPNGNLDFQVVYNGVQTFVEGYNPYLTEDVLEVAEKHGRKFAILHYANTRLLYAPGFLSVFGPIARLEYQTAVTVWIILQTAAFAALLAVAAALGGLPGEGRKAFLLAGFCFAPIHTSLAHGQPGIFFCLFTLLFFWASTTRREWLAAFAFGLLLGKPSFAVPAACVGLIRGHWRPILLGGLIGVLTWLPFVSRYGVEGSITHYAAAIQAVQAPGGDADDSLANPGRFDMVNLRSWLGSWQMPGPARDGLYWLTMTLMALLLYRFRRTPDPSGLYWTIAAVFCAVALYHRFYDAAVVIIGWPAALALWNTDRRIALGITVCLLPFFVPGTAFLVQYLGTPQPAWFEAIVLRHQTPVLIGLGALAALGLLRAAKRSNAGFSGLTTKQRL